MTYYYCRRCGKYFSDWHNGKCPNCGGELDAQQEQEQE